MHIAHRRSGWMARVTIARLVAVCTLLLLFQVAGSGQSTVTVTVPRNGQEAGIELTAAGTAHLATGEHVWILVHRTVGFREVWWPQGEGVLEPGTSAWNVVVTFGEAADIGYDFEVAAITVDEMEHSRLQDYRLRAMETRNWYPMRMPRTTSPPVIRTVRKVSHR
jgi:hypothetical protein